MSLEVAAGVTDDEGENHASDGHEDHEAWPDFPVGDVLSRLRTLLRQEESVEERHDTGAGVNTAINEAGDDADVLGSADILGEGTREHAMHADDAHGHEHGDNTDPEGRNVQDEAENDRPREHASVEYGGHWSAFRPEEAIRDDPGEDAADDAGHAQKQTPVLVDREFGNVHGLGEELIVLHNGLAQEPATELNVGHGHDDRTTHHHLKDLDRRVGNLGLVIFAGVASPEVLEASLARTILYEKHGQNQDDGQDSSRNEEDEMDGGVNRLFHTVDHFGLLCEDIEDNVAQVIG